MPIKKIGFDVGHAIGTVVGAVLFEVVFALITAGIGLGVSAAKGVVKSIAGLLARAGRKIVQVARLVVGKVWNLLSKCGNGLVRFVMKMSPTLGKKFGELVGAVKAFVGKLWKRIGQGKDETKLFSKLKMYEYKDKIFKRILTRLNKKKIILDNELAELMKYTKNGMKVDKVPTPEQLTALANKSQVEWAITSNGIKILSHGTKADVMVYPTFSTKYFAHVHFNNPYPSYLDIKNLIIMKSRGYPINGLDIIIHGKAKTYGFKELLYLVKNDIIPQKNTTIRGYNYIVEQLTHIVKKYY